MCKGARRGSALHVRPGFSLVEVVMIVTIIGIVSAIAVPRMSSAASQASTNALMATLEGVRTAIDLYYAEHGRYPGYDPSNGAADGAKFVEQLIKYTDDDGQTSDTFSGLFKYGPYLRAPFPKNPANQLDTVHVKVAPNSPDPGAGAAGWIAVLSHGYFGLNISDDELINVGFSSDEVSEVQFIRGGTSIDTE